jgi:hypothetical protein
MPLRKRPANTLITVVYISIDCASLAPSFWRIMDTSQALCAFVKVTGSAQYCDVCGKERQRAVDDEVGTVTNIELGGEKDLRRNETRHRR